MYESVRIGECALLRAGADCFRQCSSFRKVIKKVMLAWEYYVVESIGLQFAVVTIVAACADLRTCKTSLGK